VVPVRPTVHNGPMSEALQRYRQLLANSSASVASCWTVVQPVTKAATAEDVVRRLGADPGLLAVRDVSAAYDLGPGDGCLVHVEELGSAVLLFEMNGYQGSRPEVLRWLSDGARVHSAFWNVGVHSRFSYAVYGQVLTTFEALAPGTRHGTHPDALDGDLDDLHAVLDAGGGDWPAAMLAVIERRTGVVIPTDWWERPHTAVLVPSMPPDPRAPGLFGGVDPDLDSLLRLAPPAARGSALRTLVSLLAAAFDLLDEPPVVGVVDALKIGSPTDDLRTQAMAPLTIRLRQEYERTAGTVPQRADPAWRRFQAAVAIGVAALPPDRWQQPIDAFFHARNALGDEWPEARGQLRRMTLGWSVG